jgi:hypothetical protein
MKLIATITALFLSFSLFAQTGTMEFESTNLEMNKKFDKVGADDPNLVSSVKIDFDKMMMIISTTNPDYIELMRKDLDRKIIKVLGDPSSEQFSLELEDMMFAHFYLDNNRIFLTRSDIHPLKWGVQMRQIILREE